MGGDVDELPINLKGPLPDSLASSAVTTSVSGAVAWVVALVQPVASTQMTVRRLAAFRKRVRICGHGRGRVVQVLSCM